MSKDISTTGPSSRIALMEMESNENEEQNCQARNLQVNSSNVHSLIQVRLARGDEFFGPNKINSDDLLGPKPNSNNTYQRSISLNLPNGHDACHSQNSLNRTRRLTSPSPTILKLGLPSRKVSVSCSNDSLHQLVHNVRTGHINPHELFNFIQSEGVQHLYNVTDIFFSTYLRRTRHGQKDSSINQDKVFMTPFHFAILAQETPVVFMILNAIQIYDGRNYKEIIKRVLGTKTKIEFGNDDTSIYMEDDRILHGINAVHLASRFHAPSLHVIVKFLKENDMFDITEELTKERDPQLHMTPLHMATKNKNSLAMASLLACVEMMHADDLIKAKDKRQFTALHRAAKEGLYSHCQLLLDHGADPRARGELGKTPLQRARTQKIVNLLLQYGANAKEDEKPNQCVEIMLRRNPDLVEEILNAGIETNGQELDSNSLQIIYNFETFYEEGRSDAQSIDEMATHTKIVESGCRGLLKNPLADAFLHIKWQMTKRVFYLNLIGFTFFLLVLTSMAIIVGYMNNCDMSNQCSLNITCGLQLNWDSLTFTDIAKVPLDVEDCKISNECDSTNKCSLDLSCDAYHKWNISNFAIIVKAHLDLEDCKVSNTLATFFIAFYTLTWIGLSFLITRELAQAMTSFKAYCSSLENYLEFAIIVLTFGYLIVIFVDKNVAIHLGAWAVFLGWLDLTILLGEIPFIGIYIYLSVRVMKTLVQFFMVYLPVLVAFAMMFHLLLRSNESFDFFLTSLLKVFAMMIGELDVGDNFLFKRTREDFAEGSTQFALVIFILLINIVIINLLIGLTVNKTEDFLKKADIIRMEKIVRQVDGVDRWLENNPFWARRLKTKLFAKLQNISNNSSPWKVCVMPHRVDEMTNAGKSKRFLYSGTISDSESHGKEYKVHPCDQSGACIIGAEEALRFTIPSWIVGHTLILLRKQKNNNDTYSAEEFERVIMRKNALEKLQRIETISEDAPDGLSRSFSGRSHTFSDFGHESTRLDQLQAKLHSLESGYRELEKAFM